LLGHAEVVTLVDDEPVQFLERPGIEEEVEPFARGLLAGLVLAPDPLVATPQGGLGVAPVQLVESLLEGHQAPAFTVARRRDDR
jgi:hypothetical protein